MSKEILQVGDTITCHDYADMRDVLNALGERGYGATVTIGYTVRIETVPEADPSEGDGWITWEK